MTRKIQVRSVYPATGVVIFQVLSRLGNHSTPKSKISRSKFDFSTDLSRPEGGKNRSNSRIWTGGFLISELSDFLRGRRLEKRPGLSPETTHLLFHSAYDRNNCGTEKANGPSWGLRPCRFRRDFGIRRGRTAATLDRKFRPEGGQNQS